MEKKDFNKMTREIFKGYGFLKQKDRYVLFLNDITIVVRLASWRGVRSFDYFFVINDMSDQNLPLEQRGSTVVWLKAEHDLFAQGYHRHEILYENYTPNEYFSLLNNLLHNTFDPFKKYGLKYLKDNLNSLFLTREAKEYIKTKLD